MYKMSDIANPSTSTNRILCNTDFAAQESESSNNIFDYNECDIEESNIVSEDNNTNTIPTRQVVPERHRAYRARSKVTSGGKENNSNVLELMRENLEIKKERIRISKEELLLKREKFEYLKSIYTDYKDIFANIDYNIIRLKEEVEKMAPSYLT